MSNSRFFLAIIGLAICVLSQVNGNVQYPNIDEETGCPISVNEVCEYCAEDQNRLGCYCELTGGETFVTANIFTPCPSNNSDPCSSSPCQNGATCIQQGLSGFQCNCASGFGGSTCNITFPKCSDAGIDCPNGECVETNNPLLPVYCQCYDGTRRDPTGNDTCPLSPCYERDSEVPVCKNNGTCRILNNVYLCECTAGWAGVNCTRALKTPLCESQPGVCGVGRCVQSLSPPFYTCNCGSFPSTFGKLITELVKCEESGCFASNPCQNGGLCTNKGRGAFSCQCPARFTGSKCERNSACFNNPCLNGATCEAFNETNFFCKCQRYFAGQRCEVAVPDPCKSKNCGPFGVCEDNQGTAVCRCANGLSLNGLPCEDPCKTRNCGVGVCARKPNATFEAVCSCPVTRKGELCEEPNDPCRSGARCGGGYCKTDPRAPRGFTCICEGGIVKNEPCPFSRNCPIRDCGTEGVCVETDGLVPTPGSRPIYYVCTCKNGYIAANDCNGLLNQAVPDAAARCGGNGYPYPSRNPNNPIGCWCRNGTQIEEIRDDGVIYCP